MKDGTRTKTIWTIVAVTILTAGAIYVGAQTAPQPENKMVVGEVIDIAHYAMDAFRGAEHADAGRFHADAKFPIGILEEETGKVYIAVYKNNAPAASLEPANKLLSPLMGKKVSARGRVYHAQGVDLIEIRLVGEY